MKFKNAVLIILAAVLVMLLCGCGSDEAAEQAAPTAVPTEAPTSIPTAVPTAVPTATPEPVPEIALEGGAMGQIARSASVSSEIHSSKSNYGAEMVTDGINETCWQFSLEDARLGEIYLDISFLAERTVDQMWIKNGFWKINNGLDQYTRNGRPKDIGISFRYGDSDVFTDEIIVTLADDTVRADWQKVDFGVHAGVTAVRVRVLSIYEGTKFKTDVAVSEVMFVNSGKQ